MKRPVRLLGLATALSSVAALIHATLWMRFSSIALGSTVQAAAAVLAAFLVGLALGARLFEGRFAGGRRILRATIAMEIGTGVIAVAIGFALYAARGQLPVVLGHSLGLLGMLRAFAMTLVSILLPALLMGATFPVVLSAARRLGAARAEVLGLSGKNAAGGAAGTLLCGFYLVGTFGVTATLLIAGALHLLAAAACVPLLRLETPSVAGSQGADAPADLLARSPSIGQPTLYALAVLSGTAVVALEVIWTRIAAFTLGNPTMAFSTLLAAALLLLAVGARLPSWLVRGGWARGVPTLAVLLLMATAGIVVATITVNAWMLAPDRAGTLFRHSPGVLVLLRILGVAVLMALFLVPLGCLFPTGLCFGRSFATGTGAAAGRYYLWNTVGAVVGALATGFLIIPAVGTFAAASIVALLCAVAALLLCIPLARGTSARRSGWIGIATATLAIAALPLVMPAQLHSARLGEHQVLRVEDAWGIFQLAELPDGRLRATSDRTDLVSLLGAFDTTYVQEMQAHIASFLRPNARTALVLGSGFGITAGAFTVNPHIEHVDAVEILPAMVAAADRFLPYNRGYHRNANVSVIVDDGRHYLARHPGRYDIISLNATDAHLPGQAAMFNADFYEVVKKHLSPEGVVIQHAFGSDKDIVLSTLKHAFRYLRAFPSYDAGFNVAVSDSPLRPERADVDRLASAPGMRAALSDLGIAAPIDAWSIFSRGLPPSALQELLRADWVSTDDKPLLEFSRRGDPLAWFFSND